MPIVKTVVVNRTEVERIPNVFVIKEFTMEGEHIIFGVSKNLDNAIAYVRDYALRNDMLAVSEPFYDQFILLVPNTTPTSKSVEDLLQSGDWNSQIHIEMVPLND
jgi:hypothetical protein